MAWDTTLRWLNLRATTAFVTDGANQTPLTSDTGLIYPISVTVGGSAVNVGWSADNDLPRDRSAAVDPRLAGSHNQINDGTQVDLRIDLPFTGQWRVHLALGDAVNEQEYQYAQIRDTTTVLATIDRTAGTGVGQFVDATDVLHTSAANWVANQAGLLLTFATTIMNVRLGSPAAQVNTSCIATVGLQRVVSGSLLPIFTQRVNPLLRM